LATIADRAADSEPASAATEPPPGAGESLDTSSTKAAAVMPISGAAGLAT
jgi:hypothetical protein